MSRFNRKGPSEEGPMTGRGLGKCNPNTDENDMNTEKKPLRLGRAKKAKAPGSGLRGVGRGMGCGAGKGRACKKQTNNN